MTAQTVEIMGINNVGIGSDLCLFQPDTVVEWMRNGTWANKKILVKEANQNLAFLNNQIGLKMHEVLKT